MPSKNSLESINIEQGTTLMNTHHTVWRPPKPAEEKCSEAVLLKFKPSEIKAIREQAGLVPLATYLKSKLNF